MVQTLIKERFIQVNGALEAMHQTQRAWTVPDTGLKAALKERIYAHFLPAYNVRLLLSRRQCCRACTCLPCASHMLIRVDRLACTKRSAARQSVTGCLVAGLLQALPGCALQQDARQVSRAPALRLPRLCGC